MPTLGVDGRCYSQSGRWIIHWVNVLILNLRFCLGPHMFWKCLRLTFSPDLEEAMFETGESLSTIQKLIPFLRKYN